MPSEQQRDQQDTGSARRGPSPLACELFQGINTATTRSGVPDQQMFWCDGFMPLAPRNLRALPGIGSALFTAGGILTVVCFYFYNIGAIPYMVVFMSDGSVVQVRTMGGATTTIMTAGTILVPTITSLGIAQYGSQYLVIVANQTNGYWLWDGTLLYGAGTLAPQITLTNVGSAYVSTPAVVFSGGSGSGAMGVATVQNGVVTNVVLTNPGSGYSAGDTVTVTLVGGTRAGSGASLTAVMTNSPGGSGGSVSLTWAFDPTIGGFYTQPTVNSFTGGSGYTQFITPSWVYHGGTSQSAWFNGSPPSINLTVTGGVITAVTLTGSASNPSMGWNQNANFPTILITDSGGFTVTSITVGSGGTNYSPSTKVTATGGQNPVTQATLKPIIAGGVITSVQVINGGLYGGNSPLPTITASDTAVTATATVQLMPFGIQGTCVETYSGRVWVANGPVVNFTAPGSVSDFATSDGGGTFKSSDSFLRVGYTRLLQTNGFLFLIGDSSMNYISGLQVSTANNVTTTTFTNNNSDPEIGTPYPASVTTLGQDILIANQNGIYVSSGGTFVKKSEPLDGVYNTAPGVFNGLQLSAAKDLIFGKLTWMVLVPIKDPILKTTRNKIFMFNEKFWWSSEQDVTLTFIQSQEINSVFQSYGTDGTHIYPLFTTPSVAFTKKMQSRLWDAPAGYDHTKSSVNLFAMAQFQGSASLSYNIYVDNEKGTAQRAGPYVHSGTSTPDQEVTAIMPPTTVGQVGVLTGMTVETNADDLVIVSLALQDEVVGYRA